MHGFWKRPGCALIGACALIRTNMVCLFGYGTDDLCLCLTMYKTLSFLVRQHIFFPDSGTHFKRG